MTVLKLGGARQRNKDDWLVGGFFPKIKRSYVSRPKALWSLQQVDANFLKFLSMLPDAPQSDLGIVGVDGSRLK